MTHLEEGRQRQREKERGCEKKREKDTLRGKETARRRQIEKETASGDETETRRHSGDKDTEKETTWENYSWNLDVERQRWREERERDKMRKGLGDLEVQTETPKWREVGREVWRVGEGRR